MNPPSRPGAHRLLAALLALAACGKEPAKDPAGAPEADASAPLYRDPAGLFSCRAPSGWRVLSKPGGATQALFFGPPGGARPYCAAMAVYYYPPGSLYAGPEDYARAFASEPGSLPELARADGRVEFSARRRSVPRHGKPAEDFLETTLLVPAQKGFFALVHKAPIEGCPDTLATFRSLAESFGLDAGG